MHESRWSRRPGPPSRNITSRSQTSRKERSRLSPRCRLISRLTLHKGPSQSRFRGESRKTRSRRNPGFSPLTEFPQYGQKTPLYLDFARRIIHGFHGRVCWLEADHVTRFAIDPLQRRIATADQCDYNVAVPEFLTALDQHHIAIADVIVDH